MNCQTCIWLARLRADFIRAIKAIGAEHVSARRYKAPPSKREFVDRLIISLGGDGRGKSINGVTFLDVHVDFTGVNRPIREFEDWIKNGGRPMLPGVDGSGETR